MEYVHEPVIGDLKAAMAHAPTDDDGWEAIESSALIMAESGNLLLLRGPSEHRDLWVKASIGLREAGADLYHAAQKKDYKAARANFKLMAAQCMECHKHFKKE